MAALFTKLRVLVLHTENVFMWQLGLRNKPDAFALALAQVGSTPSAPISIHDIMSDAFLWAVPKHRRTIYKRRIRRFGSIDGFYKMLTVKKNILICNECGSHKEAGRICPSCYAKITEETTIMQETIQKELGLSPVDKEVVVLYDGEKADSADEFWKGKRIVEMKKERPPWFGKNLLQKTTQAPATTAAIEPKDLA